MNSTRSGHKEDGTQKRKTKDIRSESLPYVINSDISALFSLIFRIWGAVLYDCVLRILFPKINNKKKQYTVSKR